MVSISELPTDAAEGIRFVLTDIDDTLTSGGRLTSGAFDALWRLDQAGLVVIPVTGRPAGWCDCIVRQWPVEAVIGENGAFTLYRDASSIAEYRHPEVCAETVHARLNDIRRAVLERIPGARVARDQPYRKFDLAIDFREDPPDLGYETAVRIAEICRAQGAQAKISSIHVNTWFGSYDKVSMARLFLDRRFGLSDDQMMDSVMFCGDSPNDEPMFSFFPISCAVSNICETVGLMTTKPRYVSSKPTGAGFAEIVDTVLRKKTRLRG